MNSRPFQERAGKASRVGALGRIRVFHSGCDKKVSHRLTQTSSSGNVLNAALSSLNGEECSDCLVLLNSAPIHDGNRTFSRSAL